MISVTALTVNALNGKQSKFTHTYRHIHKETHNWNWIGRRGEVWYGLRTTEWAEMKRSDTLTMFGRLLVYMTGHAYRKPRVTSSAFNFRLELRNSLDGHNKRWRKEWRWLHSSKTNNIVQRSSYKKCISTKSGSRYNYLSIQWNSLCFWWHCSYLNAHVDEEG